MAATALDLGGELLGEVMADADTFTGEYVRETVALAIAHFGVAEIVDRSRSQFLLLFDASACSHVAALYRAVFRTWPHLAPEGLI